MVSNSKGVQFGASSRAQTQRQSPRGRICDSSDCATVLSIYNGSPSCSMHEQPKMKPARRRG